MPDSVERPRPHPEQGDQTQVLVACATADLSAQLGKPATLAVAGIGAAGPWAFVYAQIRGAGGETVDFSDTPLADAAANGGASRTYAGLFRTAGDVWTKVDSAVAPTDVAWGGWAEEYGAPAEVFGVASA